MTETTTENRQPSAIALGDEVSIADDPSRWPATGCVAWIESRGGRCGRDREPGQYVCRKHHTVALRRWQARQEREAQRAERLAAEAEARRPALVEKLRSVEARMARLDPPAPTTDLAAYMGRGSSAASGYRTRYTPERIHELAELHATAERLRGQIGRKGLEANGL